jgi:hypothetical protein
VKPTSAKDAEFFDKRPDKDWLNPISMSVLKAAFLKRKKQVTLNGIVYDITYGIIWKSSVLEDRKCIMLKRADGGYAPFGYIHYDRIEKFDFEKGE